MPDEAICFLRTSGMYMTEDFVTAIYRASLEMVQGNLREFLLCAKGVGEANVTTDFKVLALGHRGGIKFMVDAAVGSRQFKVEFLLDTRWLDEPVPLALYAVPICNSCADQAFNAPAATMN